MYVTRKPVIFLATHTGTIPALYYSWEDKQQMFCFSAKCPRGEVRTGKHGFRQILKFFALLCWRDNIGYSGKYGTFMWLHSCRKLKFQSDIFSPSPKSGWDKVCRVRKTIKSEECPDCFVNQETCLNNWRISPTFLMNTLSDMCGAVHKSRQESWLVSERWEGGTSEHLKAV